MTMTHDEYAAFDDGDDGDDNDYDNNDDDARRCCRRRCHFHYRFSFCYH